MTACGGTSAPGGDAAASDGAGAPATAPGEGATPIRDEPGSASPAPSPRPAELNEPKTGGPMPPEPTVDISTTTIPKPVQGRWGLVPADCTSTRGDAKGLLVIGPTTLTFYESRGTLGQVAERDASHIRATFAFEGEGQSWRRDQVLDAQDDGRTLLRREYGADSMPGPLKYTRCPA